MTTQQHPTENTMKTIIISLVPGASNGILKVIREDNIRHRYVGIDQNNQLLMELTYPEAQQSLIDAMHMLIKHAEAFGNAINAILEPIIKKQEEDEALAWKQVMEKYKIKGSSKRNPSELETRKDNGN